MPTFLSVIFNLLSGLPGILGDYFKRKQEIEEIRARGAVEKEKALVELAKERAKAEHERAVASLKATGVYFKYFTFVMWFGPYIIQLCYPPLGQTIFQNMAGMPQWYVESIVMIMFTVWGISVSAPVIGNIFKGIGTFFEAQRAYKLNKADIDSTKFFKILREIQGHVSQETVDKYNKKYGK